MIFRFGAFELSCASGELRKHGTLVRLAPQPFQVLKILIEHAGELVSRDDLRDLLWGHDDTSVEFDAGLNRCIRQIRSALSDDAGTPRYIETAPRKGYRFIAPVETLPQTPVFGSAATPRARTIPVWKWIVAGSLVFALASVALFLSSRAKTSPDDLSAVPLAVALGDQYCPTFSPDGRQVAFAWNGEHRDNFDIYLKQVGTSSAPQRLTTNEDADYSPAWSPDGRLIAFCRAAGPRGGAVFVLPAFGGTERKVIDLDSAASPNNRAISWTRDSRSLVLAEHLAGKAGKGLYVVNIETGGNRQITTPAPDEEDMTPAVSPDGQSVAFTRDTGRGVSSIMLVGLEAGAMPRPLPSARPSDFYNAHPAWTPDGSSLVFASNSGGNLHLWLLPVRGSKPAVELRALGDGAQDPAISAAGQLAFVHQTFDSNIWKIDLHSPSNPMQVAASTRVEQSPAVSPDDGRIAFESNRSGYSEIWTSRADGSSIVQITFMRNPVTGSPDWSPDGGQIVFDSRAGGRPQIYVTAANGGTPVKLTSGDRSSVVPRWSADGRSIYYCSDQTGRMEIWRLPVSGGASKQITFDGGFAPMPSRDGESLYYRSSNAIVSPLWELRIATGKRTLVDSAVVDRAYAAAPEGVYYFSGSPSEAQNLFLFNKRSLRKTLVFKANKPSGNGMMLAPDGHTLYYTQLDQNGHDLLLVNEFWK